jgi:hypothetical protein
MSVNGGPNISENGLVFLVDAADKTSYLGTGTAWNDLVGSNNGVLTNGPTFSTEGKGSIVFDGVDDYSLRNSSLNLGDNFSVFAWVKPGNINIRNAIVGNSYPYNGRQGFLFATGTNYLTSSNTFFISIGSDAAYGTAVNNTVTSNRWNYLGGTVSNGGGDIKLFVDGIQVNIASSSLFTSGNITYSTNQLLIGGRVLSSPEPWIGNIGMVQMYNRVLNADEILQNYNNTKSRFGL